MPEPSNESLESPKGAKYGNGANAEPARANEQAASLKRRVTGLMQVNQDVESDPPAADMMGGLGEWKE